MTPVEILADIIRSKKASIFLRQPTATEAEIQVAAEIFYNSLIIPYTEAYSTIKTRQAPNTDQLTLDFQ